MKIRTSDLVYWKAVDKIMYNSPQQFFLWVTKHVSKFYRTKQILHRWVDATDALYPYIIKLGLQEVTRHQLHFS